MSPPLLESFAWPAFTQTVDNAKKGNIKGRGKGRRFQGGLDDQQLLTELEIDYPDKFGLLDERFDVHLNNGKQELGLDGLVPAFPNGAAFLHFNGGGSSPGPFYSYKPKDWKFLPKVDWLQGEGWKLANFYVNLPWGWLFYFEESKVAGATEDQTRGRYIRPTVWPSKE
jgi:hypothetical protein